MTLATATPLPSIAAERISVSAAFRLWLEMAAAHDDLAAVLADAADEGHTAGADVVAILLPLAEAEGQHMRMNELADRSHLTPSGLTRRIDRLEADGLVRRVTCPSDRRGAHAQLRAQGLDVARRSVHHLGSVLERHVAARLTPTETAALSDLLARLSRERAPG